jgi:hypothetical protein
METYSIWIFLGKVMEIYAKIYCVIVETSSEDASMDFLFFLLEMGFDEYEAY